MQTLSQHLRFALRQLLRNPGFTATVILTLALSIGANTAIFSLVNALLLRSLPWPQPDRIGTVFARTIGANASDYPTNLDGQRWELLRDNVPSLISAVHSMSASGVNLQAGQHAQYIHNARVSAHYFDILSFHPLLGRNFSEDEDRPSGPKTAILSNNLWRNTFNSDPAIIGRPILLKSESYTVIGVLPQTSSTPLNADIYTALQPSRQGEGNGGNFTSIVRLRDGATWQQANAELNRAWSYRIDRFASQNPGSQISFYFIPLQQGQTSTLRPQVLALMLAAGFILLIACANLAGLALVRMLHRRTEIATRLALGATRWQIQKQLWVENLLLALLGGAAGIGVGLLALRGLLHLLPEHLLPVASVPLDLRVLAFTLALSLVTCILFGMIPALTTQRLDLRSTMSTHAASGVSSLRLRQFLIAGEVALTVVLLASSGLLIRTLVYFETLPPGFNPSGVLAARASLDDARYHDPAAFHKLLDQSLASMRAIPGVQNAAVALSLPYERALNDQVTLHAGPHAGQQVGADEIYVTPGYFETMQMPVFAGRTFTSSDGPDAAHVIIVNRTFARKFFHGQDPIGRYVNKDTRIIGVVSDTALISGMSDDDAPLTTEETVYLPAAQVDQKLLALVHVWFQPSWVVRTRDPIEGLTAQMQQALASVDPNLPFSGFSRITDLMASALATQRVEVALLGTMAALALLLSAVGIFALVAHSVTQRTREIGIRIALGSTIRQAMLTLGSSGVSASAAGLFAGLILCAVALRAMRHVLWGVGVYDAPTILFTLATLSVITILATAIPTLRIASIDPAKTLRDE